MRWYSYCTHFTDEKIKEHSYKGLKPAFKPGQSGSRTHAADHKVTLLLYAEWGKILVQDPAQHK